MKESAKKKKTEAKKETPEEFAHRMHEERMKAKRDKKDLKKAKKVAAVER